MYKGIREAPSRENMVEVLYRCGRATNTESQRGRRWCCCRVIVQDGLSTSSVLSLLRPQAHRGCNVRKSSQHIRRIEMQQGHVGSYIPAFSGVYLLRVWIGDFAR